MADRDKLNEIFGSCGFDDFKWIDPREIIVARWVRMKCAYGCVEYGHRACCPPATPPVDECARFFTEYASAAVFHFATAVAAPEDRFGWTRKINKRLTALEREVFLAGHPKAFVLHMDSCNLCDECGARREECHHPTRARPAPEAMAVDVYGTVSKIGYPIEVLTDYDKTMNRYAILLVD